jgi:hypothetical protein
MNQPTTWEEKFEKYGYEKCNFGYLNSDDIQRIKDRVSTIRKEAVTKTAIDIVALIDDLEIAGARYSSSTLEEWKLYKRIRNRIRDIYSL